MSAYSVQPSLPLSAAVVERVRHVEFLLDEHIVAGADQLFVEEHVGVGVDPAEAQHAFAAIHFLRRDERALEPPLVELVFAEVIDVLGVKGIVLNAGAHQIKLDVAGHLRVDRRPGGQLHGGGRLRHSAVLGVIIELPISGQGCFHRCFLQICGFAGVS